MTSSSANGTSQETETHNINKSVVAISFSYIVMLVRGQLDFPHEILSLPSVTSLIQVDTVSVSLEIMVIIPE